MKTTFILGLFAFAACADNGTRKPAKPAPDTTASRAGGTFNDSAGSAMGGSTMGGEGTGGSAVGSGMGSGSTPGGMSAGGTTIGPSGDTGKKVKPRVSRGPDADAEN